LVLACHFGALFIFGSAAAGDIENLWSPADSKSNSADLTLGADGGLYLSWIEKETTHALKFSSWEQERWGPAEVVVRGRFTNVADTPGMAVLDDGTTIMAHWLSRPAGSRFSTIRLTYSLDRGRTWSDPLALGEDDAWRGVHSWVPLSGDRAAFVWSDDLKVDSNWRKTTSETTTALRFSTLSRDGELSDHVLLDSDVCGECAPDLVAVGDGSLVVAYRDRTEDGVSGISCLYFDGTSWSESQPVHADEWRPYGCPVSGPAVDAQGKHVAVAWLTEDAQGRAVVRVAFSKDGGHVFEPPIDASNGDLFGRPDIALFPDGTAWVVWVEKAENRKTLAVRASLEVRLRSVAPDGNLGTPIAVGQTGHVLQSMFPHLARLGDEVYVTWTEAGPIRVVGGTPRASLSPDLVHVARVH
jgi:hypothetical protein